MEIVSIILQATSVCSAFSAALLILKWVVDQT